MPEHKLKILQYKCAIELLRFRKNFQSLELKINLFDVRLILNILRAWDPYIITLCTMEVSLMEILNTPISLNTSTDFTFFTRIEEMRNETCVYRKK